MKKLLAGAVVLMLVWAPEPAEGQGWNTPSFLGPRPGSDLGIYLVDVGDLGVHGIWRQDETGKLGLRLGFADVGDGVIHLGVETWGDIILEGADFPLDLTWTTGIGGSFNGGTAVSVPGGVSIGKTFIGSTLAVQVYGHPRLVLIASSDVNDDLTLDLDGQFDLGADFYLSEGLTLRVGASLGSPDGLGVGLAWRH